MGGNVFDTNERLPSAEALSVGEKFVHIFNQCNFNSKIIPSYRDKKDYGDVDIIIELHPDCSGTICDVLNSLLQPMKYHRNGDVISFAFPYEDTSTFQVDIILAPSVHFDFSYHYFSWNDLGNFIGRFAHKMGLKFGHDGLKYILRGGGGEIQEVVLTQNFDEALSFLQFDSIRFHQGFDALESIFEYVASNPMYYGEIFDLQARSNKARVRDKKRVTYQHLLKWIKQHPEKDTSFRFDPDKTTYEQQIIERFPHIVAIKQEFEAKVQRNIKFRQLFNGDILSDITGLSGKELGQFIRDIREDLQLTTNASLEEFVVKKNEQEIRTFIDTYNKRRNRTLWRQRIMSDPGCWETCPITNWTPFECELFLWKHPGLIKYIPWKKLSETTQSALLEKYPEIFITFI